MIYKKNVRCLESSATRPLLGKDREYRGSGAESARGLGRSEREETSILHSTSARVALNLSLSLSVQVPSFLPIDRDNWPWNSLFSLSFSFCPIHAVRLLRLSSFSLATLPPSALSPSLWVHATHAPARTPGARTHSPRGECMAQYL